MRKMKVVAPSLPKRKMKAAESIEELEDQMFSMAYELAKKQMQEGTISSQNLNFFLKLGSSRERLEREILEKQKEQIEAKTDNLRSTASSNELYEKAIEAMSRYSGNPIEADDYETYV